MTRQGLTPLTILSPVAKYRIPQNALFIEHLKSCGRFTVQLFECYGVSEVSRARNIVAARAHKHITQAGGLVLWLDADIVLLDPRTFMEHCATVLATGKAISGRYVVRQDASRIAASLREGDGRTPLTFNQETHKIILSPVMTGMGVLLIHASTYLMQANKAPTAVTDGKVIERIVCCPKVIAKGEHHVMMSEDYVYCNSLEGGAWLASLENKETGHKSYLDYGHMAERVLTHAPSPHVIKE